MSTVLGTLLIVVGGIVVIFIVGVVSGANKTNHTFQTPPQTAQPDLPSPAQTATPQTLPQSQESAPQQLAVQSAQDEIPARSLYEWNTTEIDAVKNGNIAIAANWLVRNPSTRGLAASYQPAYVAKSPWNYYGRVLKLTGVVGFVQDYPAGSDLSINGQPTSDIVIECNDGTIGELLCVNTSGSVTRGCTVNLYGFPVGITEVANRMGGTDPHLILVGNDYDNYGVVSQ